MGGCPYCDKPMFNPIAGLPLPKFQKITTECCSKTVWLYHSRIDPKAYTDEDFKKEYTIDEKTKEVTKKQSHNVSTTTE